MKRRKFPNWPARIRFTYRRRFRSIYSTPVDREGQRFTVLRAIVRPEPGFISENGPMVKIRFGDGVTMFAWPEEVVATVNGKRLGVKVGGKRV